MSSYPESRTEAAEGEEAPAVAEPEAEPDAEPVAEPDPRPRRRRGRRGRIIGVTALVVIVGAGAAAAIIKPWDHKSTPPPRQPTGTALATVRVGALSSQVNQTGTLAYQAQPDGSPYTVTNQSKGLYTWVPVSGREIKCGQWIYRVDDQPIMLLCGSHPFYRNLSDGDSGWDVRELNRNLVDLGYASKDDLDPDSDYFGWATVQGLEKLQDHLGLDETGDFTLGDLVILPGPLWIKTVSAHLGGSARPGSPVLQASSTGRQVTVNLNAAQQSQVKVGNKVQVTLPDNRVTGGVVNRIGTIANSSGSSSDSSGSSSSATIPVYITLTHPADAGSLDQAPVQVQIRTAGVDHATIVPVTALLGQGTGGYAVEKVDAQGVTHVVPVTLGMFDDADGLVQVTGNLAAGDQVVVPKT